MKQLLVCLVLLLLFTALPVAAKSDSPEYCFREYCQYLVDDVFYSVSPTPWRYSTGSGWSYQYDPCSAGENNYTGVARLEPGGIVWQSHPTDHWGPL